MAAQISTAATTATYIPKMSQPSSAAGSLAAMLLLLLAAAAAGSRLPSPIIGVSLPPCQKEIDVLQSTCLKFVLKDGPKALPSKECCGAVKALSGTEVPCVCNYLGSPAVKEQISMEKVFYVTKQCGVTIPGSCGSKQL